jgi:hypothetical protein
MASGDPDQAVREANDAIARWGTRHGFHNQHFMALVFSAQADLQRGDGISAHRRWTEALGPLKASMLPFVQIIRGYALYGRAMCALAAASQGGPIDGKQAQTMAARHARKLEREGVDWATGFAKLVRASAARARGDDAAAIIQLRAALSAFELSSMSLHAACCRRALGRLIGGDQGALLIEASNAWTREQQARDLDAIATGVVPLMPGGVLSAGG